MITIVKTKLEVDITHFKKELRSFCEKFKKHNPSQSGVSMQVVNQHFETKLKIMDFYNLSEELGIHVYNGKYWRISEILKEQ